MSNDASMSKLADIQKLQKIFSSIDIETMYAMSQSEKLQQALSSSDFFNTMASTLLFSRDNAYSGSIQNHQQSLPRQQQQSHQSQRHQTHHQNNERQMQQDLEKLHLKRQAQRQQQLRELSPKFDEEAFLQTLSNDEKMKIHQKLSNYDDTLKATLDAIKSSGNLTDNKMLQPIFQDLPSDIEMQKFFEHIDPDKKLQKLKVDTDFSVSLESDPSISNNKNADEYIEQMIKVMKQNKKFDNFLDAVSKIETVSDDENSSSTKENQREQPKTENDDKVLDQIHLALESFKLDKEVEEDIADEISALIKNNKYIFTNEDFNKTAIGENQKNNFENFQRKSNRSTENQLNDTFNCMKLGNPDQLFDPHVELQRWHDDFRRFRIENNMDSRRCPSPSTPPPPPPPPPHLNESSSHSSNKHSPDLPMMRYINPDPTPEEKLLLQRECLDRLRQIELQSHEDGAAKKSTGGKKKKNRKKKKAHDGINVSAINHLGHGDPNNDIWLCELCEYKIVYGEHPVFLTEWLQRKENQQEKMGMYQRYLIDQRKERNRQQHEQHLAQHKTHNENAHHEYEHDHDHYHHEYDHNHDHDHQHNHDHDHNHHHGDQESDYSNEDLEVPDGHHDHNNCNCMKNAHW